MNESGTKPRKRLKHVLRVEVDEACARCSGSGFQLYHYDYGSNHANALMVVVRVCACVKVVIE